MKDILKLLSNVYEYPVDIEFTANFIEDNNFKINLLQCRPLQTRGIGIQVKIPDIINEKDCFFSVKGNFMGGNIRLPVDYVVFVDPSVYSILSEQNKYAVARQIGIINAYLKGNNSLLIGPGRWGTTTPSLGVPVSFSELCNMSVICEVSSPGAGYVPELSYGSHFFQDLVETGIFYAAIFSNQKDVIYNPEFVLKKENILDSIIKGSPFKDVIHVSKTEGLEIFSDIISQSAICR